MTSVTFIRFGLTLTEPGAVTVPQPPRKDLPDLVPDTAADGRPHIPGTSLAGALRELVLLHHDQARADALFGCVPRESNVDAVASPVWVFGARLRGDEPELLQRSATAINRTRGAARNLTLRSEHLLPAGTRFEAYLRWDGADRQELADLLDLLAGWQPALGHGISRGRGRCTVGPLLHGTLDLTDPADTLTWLTCSGPELVERVAVTAVPLAAHPPAPAMRLPVRVHGPLRVGNGRYHGTNPKVAEIRNEDGVPIIPGSGLKGVIRSRAEYILRSIGATACDDQRCGGCLPCRLFGYSGGDAQGTVGARGRFRFRDAAVSDPDVQQRTHIAIDRFTGGAAGQTPDPASGADPGDDPTGRGLLYTVQALERGTFEVTVEPLGATRDDQDDLRALLRLVVQDFNDGLIGIGAGTARGYGSIHIDPGDLPTLTEARARLATMTPRTPTAAPND
jgi:CRISPR/Cas system CSM-associated protein Csm3 (group 7 of RAMP superfamily)